MQDVMDILVRAKRIEEKIAFARAKFEDACQEENVQAMEEARFEIMTLTEVNIDFVQEVVILNKKTTAELIAKFRNLDK